LKPAVLHASSPVVSLTCTFGRKGNKAMRQ
jgi:hypothetical protein